MQMYTGHRIQNHQIFKEHTKTQFDVNGEHIHCVPDQPTGFYLVDGMSQDVKHVYGPEGYTRFYVQDGHIYGPSMQLPWQEGPKDSVA